MGLPITTVISLITIMGVWAITMEEGGIIIIGAITGTTPKVFRGVAITLVIIEAIITPKACAGRFGEGVL